MTMMEVSWLETGQVTTLGGLPPQPGAVVEPFWSSTGGPRELSSGLSVGCLGEPLHQVRGVTSSF